MSSEASTDANTDGALPTPALTNASLNSSPPSLELREGDLVHIECAQAQPREGESAHSLGRMVFCVW